MPHKNSFSDGLFITYRSVFLCSDGLICFSHCSEQCFVAVKSKASACREWQCNFSEYSIKVTHSIIQDKRTSGDHVAQPPACSTFVRIMVPFWKRENYHFKQFSMLCKVGYQDCCLGGFPVGCHLTVKHSTFLQHPLQCPNHILTLCKRLNWIELREFWHFGWQHWTSASQAAFLNWSFVVFLWYQKLISHLLQFLWVF